jgi:hypothetical protein
MPTRSKLVEIFVIANLAFLALDIFLAHSINEFAHPAEWIPFWFSILATLLLTFALLKGRERLAGFLVGGVSILVGIVGTLFHLESQFFSQLTIKSLVYTAPFIAPLAYAGLGFLLMLNRMIEEQSPEWSQWIIFFSLGGFFGNFLLTLCDHAQNGFFHLTEWIPVLTSAMAIGFLCVSLYVRDNQFLNKCFIVLAVQIVVGMLGFYYHLSANLHGVSDHIYDNFLYGAPLFAPLLFPNLSLLAAIGIWSLKNSTLDPHN